MLTWWQYTVTFVGSLVVALVTTRIAQWWSAKRDYKKALENLRAEISTNAKASSYICEWVDKNLQALEKGQMVVFSCPRLNDSAWISIKGALATSDSPIAIALEDLYLFVGVINGLIRTIEELKWGVVGVIADIGERRTLMLQYTKEVVNERLLPELGKAKSLLDKKLKLSDS